LTHCAWFVPADLRIKEVCNTEHAPASVQVDALQFRPNLVISGSLPNDEDNWQTVSICNQRFTVLGGCNRCQMVNIDQATGFRHSQSQPLATLASYRRVEVEIFFLTVGFFFSFFGPWLISFARNYVFLYIWTLGCKGDCAYPSCSMILTSSISPE
jgi:hypothetical protein